MSARAAPLNALWTAAVRAAPDAPAFYFRGQVWTYAQAEERIVRCAAGLRRLGIHRGDTFGLVLRNCPEFVVLFFALCRVGAVAVPVNFLEKPERLGAIFADAGVKGCLTSREFEKNVGAARAWAPGLAHVFLRDVETGDAAFSTLLAPAPPAAPDPGLGADALAMLLYTAGTTGEPKGVMLTHGNFAANVESCRQAIDVNERDRFLCLLPMFHSFSWTVNVLLPLRLGASLVILESLLPFEPVLKAIWTHKITVFCGVPPLFAALTQKIRGVRAFLVGLVNPVRVAVSGAAPLPAAVHRRFEKTFHVPLLEGYGLTEASPVVCVNPLRRERKPDSVGPPIPGVRVKILADDETPLPVGTVGEVCVQGANVMAGYYKHSEETRAAFTRDGWLKTGDLGRLDADGYLTIVDRKKDLIIVKGLNVYPQEVEAVLLRHPGVAEAAVVGVADPTGDETVVAFVVPRPEKKVTAPALLAFCRDRLAPYKVPREIRLRADLPKNALGKVLKKDLRAEAQARRRG